MAYTPGVINGGVILTGPSSDGSVGQALVTDGDGNLYFDDVAGGPGGSYTNEEAQDAVGNILSASFEYVDATPSINLSAGVLASLALANTSIQGSTGSTDNRILRADGTGGVIVQAGAATIADDGTIDADGGVRAYGYILGTPSTTSPSTRIGLHAVQNTGMIVLDAGTTIGVAWAIYTHSDGTLKIVRNGFEKATLNSSGELTITGNLVTIAPTTDLHAATKKYVDDNIGGAPEGTAVLSTGEVGGTKFLREDGDGTCSWQTITGGGDAITTNPLSQFAATTSAQLAGVINDETGTGALVFATSPNLGGTIVLSGGTVFQASTSLGSFRLGANNNTVYLGGYRTVIDSALGLSITEDLQVSGDTTFLGAVTTIAPIADLHAATKKYVDDADDSIIASLGAVATSNDYNDLANKPDLSALNDVAVYANLASFPGTGTTDFVYIASDTGYMYRWNGSGYTQLTDQTAIWGQVGGTLSSQTDLQSALDAKVTGPSSAVDNRLVRFDLTTGTLVQSSPITADDSGNLSGIGTIGSGTITSSGNVVITGFFQIGNFGDKTMFYSPSVGKLRISDSNTGMMGVQLDFTGNTLSVKDTTGASARGVECSTIEASGIVTLSDLSGNGPGYVGVDNDGILSWSAGLGGGGDALTSASLDQFANVTQTAGQTLAITSSTTLSGGTHSGTNTGDQPVILFSLFENGATYVYHGGTKNDGGWTIYRYDNATVTRTVANVGNNGGYANLAAAWTDRVTLTYA